MAADTIRFIVTVAIVVYKGLIPVVGRMLTVQDYAEMLYRSPKTLSNLFAAYGLPSPLRIIHERIEAEAKRLLLYTNKSAKEIGEILGFEDLAAFSRFFRKMAKESISEYRKKEKEGIMAN